ncbi:MAG: DNA replication/repair protein RecF [Nitratireductor sp.]|nr:DNA replication/repair protein RecF [Nitratireductor sp.]
MTRPAERPALQPVHLTGLRLTDFRNYASLSLVLDPRHVVLTGENGSGKTNLMEAVSFLSPGRGLRRASYDQVGRAGGSGAWSVFARLEGAAGPADIGTGLMETAAGVETQRRVRVNGAQAKAIDDLLEHSRIVWLTPAMDGLFTGSAGERRKFLDRMVLAIDPLHGRRVADFEKAMRGRNRLLSEETSPGPWLDAVEAQMAELGTAIAAARSELVSLLTASIIAQHDTASPFPDAIVSLEGTLENAHGDMAASDLEAEYADRLKQNRWSDKGAGRTLEGPHRSDIAVLHRPKGMAAALCSTGEQKALLTGLVLAHAALTAQINGFPPILLLDEIAAHLDARRRAALFDLIDGLQCQAFMTGTDRALFDALGDRGQFFTVADGDVTSG